jgi:photosystem I subunit 11
MSQLIHDVGSPEIGNLATPINASGLSRSLIGKLSIYRPGLSPHRRGLEIGAAHGFFLYGPFLITGPLRLTVHAGTAGLLATLGLISILTVCLALYGNAGEGPTPPQPLGGTLETPPPADLFTREGWSEFTSGFLVGGCGGAFVAFLLCGLPFIHPLVDMAAHVWSVH